MRILQLAPLWERVPPPAYGGIEYVVGLLSDALVGAGHEVVLAASGDSQTRARLFSTHERSLRTAENVVDPWPYNWRHVAAALAEARDFDVVHNHASELAMAMNALSAPPMLTTVHNPITDDARAVWDAYQGWWNTPSRAGRRGIAYPNFAGVVYHGIDVESFPFGAKKEDYLLFLSRMSPEKGPLAAIEVARRTGKKLYMAGKVDAKDHDYFHTTVAPLIDGNQIEFLGEADQSMKRRLYKHASAVLFPIAWNEPFGLVMTEAMACGTPVIAFRNGAAPEVVWHGVSGFVVDTVEEMAGAVSEVDRFSPACVREYVQRRFSTETMTRGYVRLFTRIAEQSSHQRRRAWRLAQPPMAG